MMKMMMAGLRLRWDDRPGASSRINGAVPSPSVLGSEIVNAFFSGSEITFANPYLFFFGEVYCSFVIQMSAEVVSLQLFFLRPIFPASVIVSS